MDMRLISIMLVLGAVALLSGGAPSLAAPYQEKYSRDKCIKITDQLLAQIPINDDVMARLDDARLYYNKDVNPSHVPPPASQACDLFVMRLGAVGLSVPAACKQVMGEDKYQDLLDVLKASRAARLRAEAFSACMQGHRAGNFMRAMGIFYAVTGNN